MNYITKAKFCEITGISAETLRYYVKNGVVNPVRDQNNHYLLYTLADATRLIDTRILRSLDYSVAETTAILNQRNDYGKYLEWRDQARNKLQSEMRSLQRKMDLLERQTKYFDSDQIYGPRIARFEEMYGITADDSTASKQLIRKLQEMLPVSNIMQRFSLTDGRRELGFSIAGPGLEMLSEKEKGLMEKFGSTRILSYKEVKDINSMSVQDFQDVLDYAGKHSYRIISDLICIVLFTFTEDQKIGAGVIGGVAVEE